MTMRMAVLSMAISIGFWGCGGGDEDLVPAGGSGGANLGGSGGEDSQGGSGGEAGGGGTAGSEAGSGGHEGGTGGGGEGGSVVEPFCGDGVRQGNEECDDGDDNDDEAADACRSDCRLAWCGDGVQDDGESCDDGAENGDTAAAACRLDCTLPRCGDGVIDGDEVCDDGAANSDEVPDACRNDCTASFCGDGVQDSGEACDDGDDNDDERPDACRRDCSLAHCGDGILDAGEECDDESPGCVECILVLCGNGELDDGEECDDGDANSNTAADSCRLNCKLARCGDRVVDSGEQCDDGNTNPMDGCHGCMLPVCGNGVREQGEACDEGDDNGDTGTESCRSDCAAPRCGDGIVDAGEECDDNNDDPSDACVSCRVAFCGDGFVEAGVEICDNGNANSDSLANACRTNCEPARCGDGIIDAGESCDSGVPEGTDICSASCQIFGATCSDPVAIVPVDGVFSVEGNNLNRPSNFTGKCVTNSNPGEAIYSFTSPTDARWTLRVRGNGIDTVLGLQDTCDPAGPMLACNDSGGNGGTDTLVQDMSAGQTITIIVDGYGSSATSNAGTFTLEGVSEPLVSQGSPCEPGVSLCAPGLVCNLHVLTCEPNVCGDGVRLAPEICDDGNNIDGDGCAADCTPEAMTCDSPGSITVRDGYFMVSGSTEGLPSLLTDFTCRTSSAANGEAIYTLTATEDTRWHVRTVAPTLFDSILAVQSVCGQGQPTIACNDTSSSKTAGGDRMTFDMDAGDTVHVIIDGYSNTTVNAGVYTIEGIGLRIEDQGGPCEPGASIVSCREGLFCNVNSSTCEPPVCGDGVVTVGEECDDGNTMSGDGCSSTCLLEGNSCSEAIALDQLPPVDGVYRFTGDTGLMDDNFDLSCSFTLYAPDMVFSFTAPAAGSWNFMITESTFDVVLASRSTCGGVDVSCSDLYWYEGEQVIATMAQGETIYLVVDGVVDWDWGWIDYGVFTLQASLSP